jgi:hypothetical protein
MTSTTRKADIDSGAWVWNGEEWPAKYETGRTRSGFGVPSNPFPEATPIRRHFERLVRI